MNESRISGRYSSALFQAALEKNIIDNVNNDMVFLAEFCRLPETKEFLSNPVIVPSMKRGIFHKMLDGNVEKITLALVDLLVKNGRESFLPGIARMFTSETLKYRGITECVLTTAVPVDLKTKERIIGLVGKEFSTKVELKEEINPEIIGGFILRIEDNQIDASVRSKLRKIEKGLMGSSVLS